MSKLVNSDTCPRPTTGAAPGRRHAGLRGQPRPRAGRAHAGGGRRARSHRCVAPPRIHFIPDSLTYSVPLFLKRQCDRTLGGVSFEQCLNRIIAKSAAVKVEQGSSIPTQSFSARPLLLSPANSKPLLSYGCEMADTRVRKTPSNENCTGFAQIVGQL